MDAAQLWSRLRPDDRGLVVAVVQDDASEQILMVGYMNADALAATLEHRRVTFWSRSRQQLWRKGETSGHVLHLRELRVDCDGDALLVRATPIGPTCHTGATSCFFTRVEPEPERVDDGPGPSTDGMFARVFGVVLDRKAGRGATQKDGSSYVRGLLDKGIDKISAKIREEADELCRALAGESADRVASEAADLVFHAMVGLAARDVGLGDVAAVFAKRFGISGIAEKASRGGSVDET